MSFHLTLRREREEAVDAMILRAVRVVIRRSVSSTVAQLPMVHGVGEACCRCAKSREQLPCSPVVPTQAIASSVPSMHHGSWV